MRDLHAEPATLTWQDGSAAPEPAALPPRWQLERPLGRGGQAEVWLARDTALDQWVAVKVFRGGLDEAWRERMRREVRIGRELAHPGIVRVFELIEGDGCMAAAMEWVDGRTLASSLADGPLPVGEVLELARRLLDVLAHLHRHGIVHRDVKPSNILIEAGGRLRLADLGLARPLEGAVDVTRTNRAVGTPTYMSPEQLRGEPVSAASDLYNLGATLYHVLTGTPPYEGDSGFSVADGHLRAPIPNPRARRRDCPRWLARFVRRLLEKRPADRWPDAAAAARAFASQRRLTSPRVWRRAAASTVAAGLTIAAVAAAVTARRGEPASVQSSGDQAVVLVSAGHELWRRRFPGYAIGQSLVHDLIGDAEAEVAVAMRDQHDVPNLPASIRIFSRDREVKAIGLGGAAPGRYPDQWNVLAATRLAALDVDGDGRSEIGWLAQSGYSFASELGVADLRAGRTGVILTHAGHLHDLSVTDLDRDTRPELVAAGINNLLGYQQMVVVLDPFAALTESASAPPSSPDDLSAWLEHARRLGAARPVVAYTLLDVYDGDPKITATADGFTVRVGDRTYKLDAAGNPSGSVLFGHGPEPRRRCWDDLVKVAYETQTGEGDALAVARVLGSHPEVLAEEPMHLGAVLLLARSLSRGADPAAASEVLLAAAPRHPDSADLWIKRATYLASAGRLDDALSSLDEALRIGARTSRTAEAVFQMSRAASFSGDLGRFNWALDVWSAKFPASAGARRQAAMPAFWAFFRGDWQDPSLDDGAHPEAGLPDLRVAVAWAQLERAGNAENALVRAGELAERADARELAALLEAEALLRLGQPARAASLALQTRQSLERLGREDLTYQLWVPLADHIAAKALAAQGRHAEAAELASRAAATAPACWFGGGVESGTSSA